MAIPANYFRVNFNFNSRGPSGVRSTGFAVNWSGALSGGMVIGDANWYSEGLNWAYDIIWPSLQNLCSTSTDLVSVAFQVAGGGGTIPVTVSAGDRSGTLAPPQQAIVVQSRTATPGRRGRGRQFLPDCLESDFDDNGIAIASLDNLIVTNFNQIREDCDGFVTGTPFELGLNGMHLLHSDGGTPSRITFHTMNQQPGWLRKRGR